jgi:cation:H+ antiporter
VIAAFMFELNLFTAIVLIVAGFVLLCKSADVLVDGAVFIADHLGISPMVIGLTVVSMGTSAPELAASIAAALSGNGSIAIGNVIGSNIANIALIGGVCALLRPLAVNLRMLKVELPVMIAALMLLLPFMLDGVISRLEGFILFTVFVALVVALIRNARKEGVKSYVEAQLPDVTAVKKQRSISNAAAFVFLGLGGLTLGAKITLTGAVYVGQWAGMSEAVIGLTIIAIGTSLPELITSVVASLKEQDDISVGNLVGSNVFNTLLVVGTSSLVRPLGVERQLLIRDFPVMVIVSVVFVLLAMKTRCLRRGGGAVLLTVYVVYTAYLLITRAG